MESDTKSTLSTDSSKSRGRRFDGSKFTKLRNKFRKGSSTDLSFNRRRDDDPYIHINDLEHATEDDCLQADQKNEEIYKEQCRIHEKVCSMMEDGGAAFQKPQPPVSPPKPSNYDRLVTYRKRNIKANVIDQSRAVLYLQSIGKILVLEKDLKDPNCKNQYEAWEAIQLAENLQHISQQTSDRNQYSQGIMRTQSYHLPSNRYSTQSQNGFQSVYQREPGRSNSLSSSKINPHQSIYPDINHPNVPDGNYFDNPPLTSNQQPHITFPSAPQHDPQ